MKTPDEDRPRPRRRPRRRRHPCRRGRGRPPDFHPGPSPTAIARPARVLRRRCQDGAVRRAPAERLRTGLGPVRTGSPPPPGRRIRKLENPHWRPQAKTGRDVSRPPGLRFSRPQTPTECGALRRSRRKPGNRELRGWGTWIRTKINGVRVRCSTVELSPNTLARRLLFRAARIGCVN